GVGIESVAFWLKFTGAEFFDNGFAVRDQTRIFAEGHINALGVLRSPRGGNHLFIDDTIPGEELRLYALLTHLTDKGTGFRMASPEEHYVWFLGANFGDQRVKIFFTAG